MFTAAIWISPEFPPFISLPYSSPRPDPPRPEVILLVRFLVDSLDGGCGELAYW